MSMPSSNKRKERSSLEQQTQPPSEILTSSSVADNLSSPWMKPSFLPTGFKFVPSDEELITHYLKPFSPERKIHPSFNIPIHHVNIYKSNPKQLSVEFEKGNDETWFFITERTKMSKGGKRLKRGDNEGYWSATVGAKKIYAGQDGVGYVTALEYCVGKQPYGVKTDWLMHEYWFESSDDNEKVDYALCKIYLTPRAAKKKKEEIKVDEKMKKGESVSKEEVKQLDLHQPDQSQLQQPHDCLQHQEPQPQPQPQPQPLLYNFDDFSECFNFEKLPVIPDVDEDFFTELMKSLEESNNSGLLDGFNVEGMIRD